MPNGPDTSYSSSSRDQRRRRRKQQARRRLLVLLVVIVVLVVALVAAAAVLRGREDDSPGAKEGGETAAGTTAKPTPTIPPPEVWVASEQDPVRVWIGGDSLGGELAWSLGSVLTDSGTFKPVTFYKESTGICRYDFFDWQREIESVSASAKPDAAVIMMGTNDTQSVWKDGTWIPYGDMAWKKAYEKRVGDIIDTLLDGGARRVYWVGMPAMGEDWRNSRMRFINKIFRKQAEKRPGAEYVDSWDLSTRADGTFDPSLRAGDGVHFTAAGQALLAERVYEAVKADWLPPGSEPASSAEASPSASAPAP